MIVQPKIVQKGWGEEVWIHNDKEYCGKYNSDHYPIVVDLNI